MRDVLNWFTVPCNIVPFSFLFRNSDIEVQWRTVCILTRSKHRHLHDNILTASIPS